MAKKVVILGAGLSGLSLGWFLKKKFGDAIQLTILEKTNRVGGSIQTIKKDGFLFELGPHSCRRHASSAATLNLVESLKLTSKMIFPDPSASKRYLLIDQHLKELPQSILGCFSSPWLSLFLTAAWKDWRTPKGSGEDESVASFCTRRFGLQLTEKMMDPLTLGIYAGNIRQLSMRSCFPQMCEAEQEYGSVIKGIWSGKKKKSSSTERSLNHPFFSFEGGMSTLTFELQKHLANQIQINSNIHALHFGEKGVEVVLEDQTIQADHLFSTIPAKQLAAILPHQQETLIHTLNSIGTACVTVVNLGFKKNTLKQKGFGYLIPTSEKQEALGVIWSSCVFPQHHDRNEETRLTVMLRGLFSDETEGLQKALDTIKQHMKINDLPDSCHISQASIPQYCVGHQDKLQTIEKITKESLPALTILGYSFYGISINDCIQHAEKAANTF